jgi:hypothetical protein
VYAHRISTVPASGGGGIFYNAGLCGPLVSVGDIGIRRIPTAPTWATSDLLSRATDALPRCEELRLINVPLFCCIEGRKPELARSVCRECGTGRPFQRSDHRRHATAWVGVVYHREHHLVRGMSPR